MEVLPTMLSRFIVNFTLTLRACIQEKETRFVNRAKRAGYSLFLFHSLLFIFCCGCCLFVVVVVVVVVIVFSCS